MYKKSIISLILFSLTISAQAAERYDTKGFRNFTKLCTSCHGTPFYASQQIDADDWEFYFKKDETLLKIHKKDPKALEIFRGASYGNKKKRMAKFLIDNAADSGKVHGCDANFCGTNH